MTQIGANDYQFIVFYLRTSADKIFFLCLLVPFRGYLIFRRNSRTPINNFSTAALSIVRAVLP